MRIAAVVFAGAALLCLARVGLGWLAGGLTLLLGALAVTINGATLTALDTTTYGWLGAHRSRMWHAEARVVFGYLGNPVHFAVAVVFCGMLLSLHARSVLRGPLLVAGVGIGVVVEQTLKAIIGRTAGPISHYSHGFPSGHVTVWGTFLGTLAVCLGIGRSRAVRAALAVAVFACVSAVGIVALYSGAHIVTDVIGGTVLSAALVASGAAVLRAPQPRVRLASAAEVAAAVSAHTAPMRIEELRSAGATSRAAVA